MINLPEPFLWLDLVLQIIDPRQAHWLQSIDLTEYSFQRWCTQPSSKKITCTTSTTGRNNHLYNCESSISTYILTKDTTGTGTESR